jgi:xanthine dehydrogenase YagT iron-sulfur-binding subunit
MVSETQTKERKQPISAGAAGSIHGSSTASDEAALYAIRLRVNGKDYALELDPRTTLLDALREHLRLTGSKKGCDQGQCGACTVLVEGRRINGCLTLAVMHDGDQITTIEGLGTPATLHPMQDAFVKHDGLQCGYCTPGQIISAVAVLQEISAGIPSHVTSDLNVPAPVTDQEIRERMSGNICRCAAYPNIIAAVRDIVGEQQ